MPFFKKKLSEAPLQGSLDFKELTDPTYFLENHPDAVYTLNLAGEIVSFNQKLAFLLGYEGTTLANQPIQSFLRPSEAERIAPFKQRALHGETVHFTAEVRHKDGRRLTMTVTNIPIYQNHIIIGLYGIARDISQHVALRKQLLSTSGFPVVPISINLSAKRLLHGNFVETVKTCLKRHNIQARFLQFELPENVLLENNEFVKETLTHLHRLGIRLTLDRYGSSATSLACLRDYPITTLKLDRSFVAQLEEADQSTALLKTIIYFAKELELTVVAEGVETLHQLDLFRDFECHAVQGYLFSRPVSASELVNVLRLGVLSPIESLKASPKQQLPSVHAQVTITRLNGKTVNVGASPILITRSTNRSVHFYASIRLPVDHQIELSLRLKDVDHPRTIIEPLAITELDNGLFHYSADYKVRAQSILLMKALEHSEQQKLDDFFSLT